MCVRACRPQWWVTRDPCGLITANVTVGLLLFAEVVISYNLLYPWMGAGDPNFVFFTLLVLLAAWSHSKAQYSNPGTVPLRPHPDTAAAVNQAAADGEYGGARRGSTEPLMSVHVDSGTAAGAAGGGAVPVTPTSAAAAAAAGAIVAAPIVVAAAGTAALAGAMGGGSDVRGMPHAAVPVSGSAPIATGSGAPAAPPGVSGLQLLTPATPKPQQRLCTRCRVPKPYRAHHCSVCNRCVVRMDHHCPWVNNCVAYMNQRYFLQFLAYTFLCCCYSGLLLVVRFATCTRNPDSCTVSDPQDVALCIGVFVEALVFGCFTITMLCDQLWAIFENNPGIDALQRRRTALPLKSRYDALQDVFGEPFGWRWFVPLAASQKLLSDFDYELNRFEEDRHATSLNAQDLAPKQR